MTTTKLLPVMLALLAAVTGQPRLLLAAQTVAPKPNIVVILVDDMGFSDIGCYGSEIPTPNLDRLASEGLRFTQFYNMGRCCPTRASLLTGLYPHQTGLGFMTYKQDLNAPGYLGHLNNHCVTIAEVLRGAGYFTAMSGKWHVGQNYGVVPWQRGFERSLSSPVGGFYYPEGKHDHLYLNGRSLADDAPELPRHWYTTDLYTDFGLKFIDEAIAAKRPFFLYLAYNAPHYPLQAPSDEIGRFRGKYKLGWDRLREQRHAQEQALGVVDKAWTLSPRPQAVPAWDSLSAAEQDRFDNIMAIYAACVAHVDTAVGRLVQALQERRVLDQTLLLFLSDNGGNAESGVWGRLEAGRHSEGWPAKPGNSESSANAGVDGSVFGTVDSTVYCGESWANLEDTPFRRYKHFDHEGGIATPLIVRWPSGFKAQGELRQQPGHVIDIMATCVDVAGATYPAQFQGSSIAPMEGRSLVPAFADKPVPRDALYWEHEGNAAVRTGDWKLVRLGARGRWELYNLKCDRTELHDLSSQETQRVKELADLWDTWALRTHVMPYPAFMQTQGKKTRAASR